jgi:hypothetical protein
VKTKLLQEVDVTRDKIKDFVHNLMFFRIARNIESILADAPKSGYQLDPGEVGELITELIREGKVVLVLSGDDKIGYKITFRPTNEQGSPNR